LENSVDFTNENNMGRGSFVYFNQASMFTGPETGYDTLAAARASGLSGKADFKRTAQQAFTDMTHFFPYDGPAGGDSGKKFH